MESGDRSQEKSGKEWVLAKIAKGAKEKTGERKRKAGKP
jgi:hypothetical protein